MRMTRAWTHTLSLRLLSTFSCTPMIEFSTHRDAEVFAVCWVVSNRVPLRVLDHSRH